MNNLQSFPFTFTQSLGWALCNSLWQGLAVLLLTRLVLKAIHPRYATVRYNISLAGLLVITLWFADTFIQHWQKLQGATVTITESAGHTALVGKTIITLPSHAINQPGTLAGIFYRLESWFPFIVGLYIAGIAFFLVRLCYQLYNIKALRTRGIHLSPTVIQDQLRYWQGILGIKRNIGLYISQNINVPAMIGTLKPVILLPLASINNLSTEQLDAILLHELAHIKRHDYLVNLLQTIVETILFFNPAVWLLSSVVREEREHCCDDVVLAHTYPLSYAQALTAIASSRLSVPQLTIGATGTSGNQLLRRIMRIMEQKPQATTSTPVAIALVAGIALILAICFSPSFAQSRKTNKKQTQKKESKIHVSEETYTSDKSNGSDANNDLPVTNTEPAYDFDDTSAPVAPLAPLAPPVPPVPPVPGTSVAPVVPPVPSVAALPAMPDVDKIVKDALAAVNWQEIGDNIDVAIKKINWDEIDSSIESSMMEAERAIEEVDWKKMQTEMQASVKGLSKAEQTRIKAEMEKAYAERRRAIAESRKAREESRKALEKSRTALLQSRETVRKAREEQRKSELELKSKRQDLNGRVIPQELINEIVSDGLLDTTRSYRLSIDHSKLIINGKKQPSAAHKKYIDKYGKFFNSIETSKTTK